MSKRATARIGLLAVLLGAGLAVPATGDGLPLLARSAPAGCIAATGLGYTSIGNEDNGRTVCVSLGERLVVVLTAPTATAPRWLRVGVSPAGILAPSSAAVPVARSVTADFTAVRLGTAELSSVRHVCPSTPSSQVSCAALEVWRTIVEVLGVQTPTSPRLPSGPGPIFP